MADLKPCPFCGGAAELDTRQAYLALGTGRSGSRIAVYCRDCGADIGICREDVPSIEPEQVVELWQRRVLPDDLPALVRRLVRALREAAPGNELAEQTLDYLRRHGLQGSPLRADVSGVPGCPESGKHCKPVDGECQTCGATSGWSNKPIEPGELLVRIDAAIKRITSGNCSMRVPADETDPDLVLADCRTLLRHGAGVPAAPAPAEVKVTDAGWAQLWVHGVHIQSGYGQGAKECCDKLATQINANVSEPDLHTFPHHTPTGEDQAQ